MLCGSFAGALWALKCVPAVRSEACSGLFTLAEAEISQRQLRAWTAGGGSRFGRAFSKHKKENEKREKEKKCLRKGRHRILKPTQRCGYIAMKLNLWKVLEVVKNL